MRELPDVRCVFIYGTDNELKLQLRQLFAAANDFTDQMKSDMAGVCTPVETRILRTFLSVLRGGRF